MKSKLPKKTKNPSKKKLTVKILLIILSLVILVLPTTLFLINPQAFNLTNANSKLLNLIQREDTEEDSSELKDNDDTKDQQDTNNQNDSTPTEEEESNNTNTNTQTPQDEDDDHDDEEDTSSDTQTSQQEDEEDDDEEDIPEPEPTVPESPSAYVAFYADNQSDCDADDVNHQRVVNYILATGANPIFHAGDLMEDGTQDSLNRFNDVTETLRATRTFYAALGNNDRKVGDSTTPSQLFLDNFSFPNNERWYSVNYGNLHMIILDSAFAASSTTQLNWLSSDLQSDSSQDRITGVMFHHPNFSSTISSYLVDYGADFIISGHLHSYNHYLTNGIDQFVLSGQPNIGYIVGRVYSDEIKITVYNSSNSIIDTVTIEDR